MIDGFDVGWRGERDNRDRWIFDFLFWVLKFLCYKCGVKMRIGERLGFWGVRYCWSDGNWFENVGVGVVVVFCVVLGIVFEVDDIGRI